MGISGITNSLFRALILILTPSTAGDKAKQARPEGLAFNIPKVLHVYLSYMFILI